MVRNVPYGILGWIGNLEKHPIIQISKFGKQIVIFTGKPDFPSRPRTILLITDLRFSGTSQEFSSVGNIKH